MAADDEEADRRAPLELSDESAGILMILIGLGLCGYFTIRIVQIFSESGQGFTGALYLAGFVLFGIFTIAVGWIRLRRGLRQQRRRRQER